MANNHLRSLMKARLSTTPLLFLFLSGLTAWYFVYEKQIKVKNTAQEESSKKLVLFSKDEIQELDIAQSTDSSFKLKRSGTDWLLTAPVEDLADIGVVNSLLTTLTSSEQERVIDENPTDLDVFGLAKPSLTIRVAKDPNSSQEIIVGNQTQVGFSVYVRTSASKQVVKTNRALLSSFQKSLFELRNKSLVSLKKAELKEVELQNSTGQIIATRNSEDKWILGREASPVDSAEWGKALNLLTDLKAVAIASEKAELANFKLDKPTVKAWLSEGPEKPKLGIFFSQMNGKVFAKRDDKPLIYEVDKGVLTELSKSASTFKDLHLVSFNRFAVSRIKLSRSGTSLEFKKEGPAWISPGGKPDQKIDPGKIEKFLTTLQDSKVTSFGGLQKATAPGLTIELFEQKDEKETLVAKVEFSKQKSGNVSGTSNHLNGAWSLAPDIFKQLNLTQEDFLEIARKAEEKES
ncbi:MAG: DUF4340 domain-containing protein [Pseudomonadota bacterium]